MEVDSSPPDSPASNPRSPQSKEKVRPTPSPAEAAQSRASPRLGTTVAHLVCERERIASSLPAALQTRFNLHVEVKRSFLPIPGMLFRWG